MTCDPFSELFADLYLPDDRDRIIFGELYTPPDQFVQWQEYRVAHLPKLEGGDGQPVDIYETRAPARFFRLHALPSTDSLDQPKPSFHISTGSGDEMGRLLVEVARQITRGMLAIHFDKEDPS